MGSTNDLPTMTLEPAEGYLFCRKLQYDTRTKSGLYLPGDEGSDGLQIQKMAYVINTTNGSKFQRFSKIIYKSYAEHEIELDGTSFILIPEIDVLAVIMDIPKHKRKAAAEELDQVKRASTLTK